MQVATNQQLIKQKKRLGAVASAVGMAALGLGFVLSFQMSGTDQQTDWLVVIGAYGILLIALLAFVFGRYHLARWSRRPRADEVLIESLPGLDSRYYIFNYIPGVPVDHLLLTPQGVLAIVAKHITGQFSNSGDRWRRKFSVGLIFGSYSEGALGNPTAESQKAERAVRAKLEATLGEDAASVPVSAAIVFTDSTAKLRLEDPAVPVLTPRELRDHIRTLHPDAKLSGERLERIANALAPERASFVPEIEVRATPSKAGKQKKKSRWLARPKQQRKRPKFDSPAQDQSKMGRNREERRMYAKKK